MITLRRARDSDAPALAALAERTFRETFTSNTPPDDMEVYCAASYGAAIQAGEISDRGLVTLLAESGDAPVGYAQWRRSKSIDCVIAEQPSELGRIYVGAEWHGRGVAQQLMHNVLALAVAAGCDCVWLGVWEQNLKAAAFYRKFGFEVVGEHAFVVGCDQQRDLIMAKPLSTP